MNQLARSTAVEARRELILDAAKEVFFEGGYGAASMDRIAEAAGVTKRTVYAHFTAKEQLFAAVVERGRRSVVDRLPRPEAQPDDPAEGLPAMLRQSRVLMQSPGCVRLSRIIVAEAETRPQFAGALRAAYAEGEALLAQALDRWVAAGRLKPHDTAVAARLLNNQAGCAPSFRALLDDAHTALDDAAMDAAAAAFLAAYRA